MYHRSEFYGQDWITSAGIAVDLLNWTDNVNVETVGKRI